MKQLLLNTAIQQSQEGGWIKSFEHQRVCIAIGIVILIGLTIFFVRLWYMRKKYPPGKGKIYTISYPGPKARSAKEFLKERHDALFIRIIVQTLCKETNVWHATIECYGKSPLYIRGLLGKKKHL